MWPIKEQNHFFLFKMTLITLEFQQNHKLNQWNEQKKKRKNPKASINFLHWHSIKQVVGSNLCGRAQHKIKSLAKINKPKILIDNYPQIPQNPKLSKQNTKENPKNLSFSFHWHSIKQLVGIAHLERSLVLLELSQPIDGVKDIATMDGKALAHPALKGRGDGLSSSELLHSRAERVSGLIVTNEDLCFSRKSPDF